MKWTEEHVPDQSGRTAIVTGSNTGLGFETAWVLAARGAKVVPMVRDVAKGKAAAAAKIVGSAPRAPKMGALGSLRAATDPHVQGGQFFGPDGSRELRGYPVLVRSSRQSHDVAVQGRLWTVSRELTDVSYPV